jgi:type I restriction enzyme S subunit
MCDFMTNLQSSFMAFTVIHSSLASVLRNKHQRLDAKYFAVQEFFNAMAKRHALEIESLGILCSSIVSGSYVAEYTTPDQGIPYIRVGDIKPFSLDEYEEDLAFVLPDVNKEIKTERNDILIARTQATTNKLGTAALVDEYTEGWATSQHVTRIVANPQKISPFYLAAYCNSRFFKAQTTLASQGDTRVEFTHSQLAEVQVIKLSDELYNTIVSQVQKAVTDNRTATDLLDEAKQELLESLHLPEIFKNSPDRQQRHFSISVRDMTAFDIWNATAHTPFLLGLERHITNSFATVPLGKVAELSKGHEVGSALYDIYLNKQADDYAFIRTSDILNHEIDLFPDYFVRKSIASELQQDVQPHDILFTKDGKIGQVAMVTEQDRAIIASGVVRIRLRSQNIGIEHEITPEYLFAVLSLRETGYYPARRRTVIGTTIPHLREERLSHIPIPLVNQATMKSMSDKIRQAFVLKTARKKAILNVLNLLDSVYDDYAQDL